METRIGGKNLKNTFDKAFFSRVTHKVSEDLNAEVEEVRCYKIVDRRVYPSLDVYAKTGPVVTDEDEEEDGNGAAGGGGGQGREEGRDGRNGSSNPGTGSRPPSHEPAAGGRKRGSGSGSGFFGGGGNGGGVGATVMNAAALTSSAASIGTGAAAAPRPPPGASRVSSATVGPSDESYHSAAAAARAAATAAEKPGMSPAAPASPLSTAASFPAGSDTDVQDRTFYHGYEDSEDSSTSSSDDGGGMDMLGRVLVKADSYSSRRRRRGTLREEEDAAVREDSPDHFPLSRFCLGGDGFCKLLNDRKIRRAERKQLESKIGEEKKRKAEIEKKLLDPPLFGYDNEVQRRDEATLKKIEESIAKLAEKLEGVKSGKRDDVDVAPIDVLGRRGRDFVLAAGRDTVPMVPAGPGGSH
eukprot:g4556.t1